jgi:LPS sulfotransferase NodH
MKRIGWHPHFGVIAGKGLSEFLAQLPAAPKPTSSIVIASDERSGSEWLCQMMGATGRLGRPTEYFNTQWMQRFIADYPDTISEQTAIAHRAGTTPDGCFSMKLHMWHFERLAAEAGFAEAFPKPHFVRLVRRDILAQAISLFRARQTDNFHSGAAETEAPVFDADGIETTLRELVQSRSRWELYFARNGITPLTLEYETLHHQPRRCVQQIARLVGKRIPAISIKIRLGLSVQHDKISAEWKAKFLDLKGDLERLD